MKKTLLFSALMVSLSLFSFAQLTSDDVNILFDGKTAGNSVDNWLWDNDGTNHMSTLDIVNNVLVFGLNTNHASWYPNLGESYTGKYLDCSAKNKLMMRVQLPETPDNFKIEPLGITHKIIDGSAASYGWDINDGDTVRLNSGDVNNSNPEFASADLATGGGWQILEYEVGNWNSTFPAKNVWMDSTKIIGVRVYYGWNTGDAALTATVKVDWAVFVSPATTTADVEAYMNEGSSSLSEVDNSSIAVYPNPASNIVNIDTEAESLISLISIDGRVLQSFMANSKNTRLNISGLKGGLYLIKVENSSGKFVEKLTVW